MATWDSRVKKEGAVFSMRKAFHWQIVNALSLHLQKKNSDENPSLLV